MQVYIIGLNDQFLKRNLFNRNQAKIGIYCKIDFSCKSLLVLCNYRFMIFFYLSYAQLSPGHKNTFQYNLNKIRQTAGIHTHTVPGGLLSFLWFKNG